MLKMKKILLVLSAILCFSCDDYFDEQPVDLVSNALVISDAASANTALLGAYLNMYERYTELQGHRLPTMGDALDGNRDLNLERADFIVVTYVYSTWSRFYESIYNTNFIIEQVPDSEIAASDQPAIIAEARFIRANIYFTLIQLYGDIPLTTTTDLAANRSISRTDQTEVLAFLQSELETIIPDLPISYATVEETKVRGTRAAGYGLLTKIYALQENWTAAEEAATTLIDQYDFALVADYESLYSTMEFNSESIYQAYMGLDRAQSELLDYLPEQNGFLGNPSEEILEAYEPGDVRRASAILQDSEGTYFVNKYRDFGNNRSILYYLRLADIILLRAEARARQNNLDGAIEDLNTIRNRAGLPNTAASSQTEALAFIEQERFVELCFEGHRWFDLKRTGRLNEVMSKHIGAFWEFPKDALWPIPDQEIIQNPNLLPNNPGY